MSRPYNSHILGVIGLAAVASLGIAGCTAATGSPTAHDTLHVAEGGAPNSFEIGHNQGGENTVQLSVYDTVIHQAADGQLLPGLATHWMYNQDRTQLTLTIRTGSKFTDGEPVDAAAVAKSLEADHTGPSTSGDISYVTSIQAPNPTTVVITLSQPNAALVPLLAGIDGAVAAPSTIGSAQSATDPIGSGPYILDEAGTQIGSTYPLTKNDSYWDSKAYPFKTIVYSVLAPTAAFDGLRSGQLDFAQVTPAQAKQLPSAQFVTGVDKATTFGAIWIADRDGKIQPALANLKVREAINMVFDRNSIGNLEPGVLHGTDQLYNPGGGAYIKALAGAYPYNVNEARELMAEAGYAKGFTVTMPAVAVITGQVQSLITQSLGEIGIKVNWQNVTLANIVGNMMTKDYPMYFFPDAWTSSDAQDTQNFLGAAFNPFGNTTPELHNLVAAANTSGTPGAFASVNRYFIENAWFVPLEYNTFYWAHTKWMTYTPPTIYRDQMPPSMFGLAG